jgi:hypothetical protein
LTKTSIAGSIVAGGLAAAYRRAAAISWGEKGGNLDTVTIGCL